MFSKSGYYELVGPPGSGKTTVAMLLCLSKRFCGRSLYVATPQEFSPGLVEAIRGAEDIDVEFVETVADFFNVVRKGGWAFIALDSLASLGGNHPDSRQVARAIARHWAVPSCPVLVVNQERWPCSPGGSLWRAALKQRFILENYRQRPFLLSRLVPTSLWLIWPELRALSEEERRLWVPRVRYGR